MNQCLLHVSTMIQLLIILVLGKGIFEFIHEIKKARTQVLTLFIHILARFTLLLSHIFGVKNVPTASSLFKHARLNRFSHYMVYFKNLFSLPNKMVM